MKDEKRNVAQPVLTEPKQSVVKEMILWWEKRRLLYNAFLIIPATLLIIHFWNYPMRTIIGGDHIILDVVLLIFGANVFYTLGWGFGVVNYYLFKSSGLSDWIRWSFFVLGTLFSLLWTTFYIVIKFDVLFA